MPRNLQGTISIHGVDDEFYVNMPWPIPDIGHPDEVTDQSRGVGVILQEHQGATYIPIESVRWGGECRVEINNMQASVLDSGELQVSGVVDFFEGTSEDTDDREDTEAFSFVVGRTTASNQYHTTHDLSVYNNEPFGGDFASIHFDLTNTIIEDV